MKEIWKPIPFPEYEGWYEASSLGRIRRASQFLRNGSRSGGMGKPRKPQARPPAKSRQSSIRPTKRRPKIVLLFNYKRYSADVGRLVAMAFHGLPKEGEQCNHKDGDPWNNVPENLEWVSRLENMRHAHRNRLLNLRRGEEQTQAKLTEDAVRYIRKKPRTETRKELARKFGVTEGTIKNVLSGKRWKHVTDHPHPT